MVWFRITWNINKLRQKTDFCIYYCFVSKKLSIVKEVPDVEAWEHSRQTRAECRTKAALWCRRMKAARAEKRAVGDTHRDVSNSSTRRNSACNWLARPYKPIQLRWEVFVCSPTRLDSIESRSIGSGYSVVAAVVVAVEIAVGVWGLDASNGTVSRYIVEWAHRISTCDFRIGCYKIW